MDTGILQRVCVLGYCKVVDPVILQGVWILEYCRVCGYRDFTRIVPIRMRQGVWILGHSNLCAYLVTKMPEGRSQKLNF